MTDPLDELRLALTTIDRESAEATPGEWGVAFHPPTGDIWIENRQVTIANRVSETDVDLIVSAVALYRGVVRDKLAEAVETGTWGSALLDIARFVNSRTEGAGK